MAHIIIEHSKNLEDHHNVQDLVDALHKAGSDHELADLAPLRSRAASREHFKVGNGDPKYAMVAIIARVGPGRDQELKQSFMTALLDTAEAHLSAESQELVIAYSVEVQEIDSAMRINRNHVKTDLNAKGIT